MRLLLDECVPRRLKHELTGHNVQTVGELGWSSKRNSELLGLVLAHGFECLITVDQNLEFQQEVSASGVSVVVLLAKTNRFEDLQPAVPAVLAALAEIRPGNVTRVKSPAF